MAIPSCQACESATLISLVSIVRRRRHASTRRSRPWPTGESWSRSRTDSMPSPTPTIRRRPDLAWMLDQAFAIGHGGDVFERIGDTFRALSSAASRFRPESPSTSIALGIHVAQVCRSRRPTAAGRQRHLGRRLGSRSGRPPSGRSCARRTRPRPSPVSSSDAELARDRDGGRTDRDGTASAG